MKVLSIFIDMLRANRSRDRRVGNWKTHLAGELSDRRCVARRKNGLRLCVVGHGNACVAARCQ